MKGFIRPKAEVLPESALVPEKNQVNPPSRITHTTVGILPYYYEQPTSAATKPDGQLAAGTRVATSAPRGAWCRVITEKGLAIFVQGDGLKELEAS